MPIGIFKLNALAKALTSALQEYISTLTQGEIFVSDDTGSLNSNLGTRWPWPAGITWPAGQPFSSGQWSFAPGYSADGVYFAHSTNLSPYIVFYKKISSVWTRIADTTVTTGVSTDGKSTVIWSPDGTYVCVLLTASPGFKIFKRSSDTFTLITTPTLAAQAYGGAWNADSTSLAINGLIYNRSGDTFTAIGTQPSVTGTVRAAQWNPAGTSIAFTSSTSPFLWIYNRSGDTFTKVANPATLPAAGATVNWCAWNNDGTKLAYSEYTMGIYVYNRSGDIFTKITTDPSLAVPRPYQIQFSPDGTKLIGASSALQNPRTGPAIKWWSVSGNTFTALTAPSNLNYIISGFSLSADGTSVLAQSPFVPYLYELTISGTTMTDTNLARTGAPAANLYNIYLSKFSRAGGFLMQAGGDNGMAESLMFYSRSGSAFTKLAQPAAIPTVPSYGADWIFDDSKIGVASFNNAPYIYNRSGNTFTRTATMASPPSGINYCVAWNPDGTSVVFGTDTSPYVFIYNRSGNTYTKIANPSTLPTGSVFAAGWNNDGTVLALGLSASPFIYLYNRSGDTFTKVTNPGTLPTTFSPIRGDNINWSPNGTYLNANLVVYQRSGDTYTVVPQTNRLTTRNNAQWITDSSYYASTSTSIAKFIKIGNTFTNQTVVFDYPIAAQTQISYVKA